MQKAFPSARILPQIRDMFIPVFIITELKFYHLTTILVILGNRSTIPYHNNISLASLIASLQIYSAPVSETKVFENQMRKP